MLHLMLLPIILILLLCGILLIHFLSKREKEFNEEVNAVKLHMLKQSLKFLLIVLIASVIAETVHYLIVTNHTNSKKIYKVEMKDGTIQESDYCYKQKEKSICDFEGFLNPREEVVQDYWEMESGINFKEKE